MSTSCHGERFGAVENIGVACQFAEAGPMRKPSTLRATAAHSEAEEARVITTIGLLRTSFARMVAR